MPAHKILTKTVQRGAAVSVRRLLSRYMAWLEPHVIRHFDGKDADHERWEALLQARDELEHLVHAERVAGGSKRAAFVARRAGL
jgi:hypothetical protein